MPPAFPRRRREGFAANGNALRSSGKFEALLQWIS
jgi:hypothetical protein